MSMKGRGRTVRMAATAAPRSSAANAAVDVSTTGAGFVTDGATAGGGYPVTPQAVADPTSAPQALGGPREELVPESLAEQTLARALARADEQSLPMDETEYTDAVNNEFIRGRMRNVVRVATGEDIEITFGDGFHTDMSGTVQLDPNDPSPGAPP